MMATSIRYCDKRHAFTNYCSKCGLIAVRDAHTDEWRHWNHTPLCPVINGPAAVTTFKPTPRD